MIKLGKPSGVAPRRILPWFGLGLMVHLLSAAAGNAQVSAPVTPAAQPVASAAPAPPASSAPGIPEGPAETAPLAPPLSVRAPQAAAPAAPPASAPTSQPAPPPPHALAPAPPPEPAVPPPAVVPAVQLAPAELTGLLGHVVVSAGASDLGRIVDLLVDGEGRVRAVVIDVGGFMGVGSRKVAVAWSALRFAAGAKGPEISIPIPPDRIQSWAEYIPGRPVAILGTPGDGP